MKHCVNKGVSRSFDWREGATWCPVKGDRFETSKWPV